MEAIIIAGNDDEARLISDVFSVCWPHLNPKFAATGGEGIDLIASYEGAFDFPKPDVILLRTKQSKTDCEDFIEALESSAISGIVPVIVIQTGLPESAQTALRQRPNVAHVMEMADLIDGMNDAVDSTVMFWLGQ